MQPRRRRPGALPSAHRGLRHPRQAATQRSHPRQKNNSKRPIATILKGYAASLASASVAAWFPIHVNDFSAVLKTMKPKLLRALTLRDPTMKLAAVAQTIELLGEFENSSSVPAEVLELGASAISLNPVIRVLST